MSKAYYTPYKTEFRGWMFKTGSGKIDDIWSEESAKKIATISKADDLEEARTGTSVIAKVLREHFEREGEL